MWPFTGRRSEPATTQAALWAHLDACDIAFRSSVHEIAAQHGSRPAPWDHQIDLCDLPSTRPFIPHVDHGPQIQTSPSSATGTPPECLWFTLHGAGDYRINYARAAHGLAALFGPGEERHSQSQLMRHWTLGRATVTCMIYLPDQVNPDALPARIKHQPDALSEACICVTPAWPAP